MRTINEIRAERLLNTIKEQMDFFFLALVNLRGSFIDGVTPANKAKKMAKRYFERVRFYDSLHWQIVKKYGNENAPLKMKDFSDFAYLYDFFK